jgi:L-2-hydroxyglutarate oxidase LhgO
MSHSLGIAIESLVAVLLILTIGYCMLLNSRLKRLKADEHSLKAVIGELITATEIAERAIGGLKQTVRDVNEHLGNQLATAGQMSQQLKQQLAEGDYVVRRLTKIAIAARPSNATEPEAKTDLRTDMTADIKTDAPKVSAAKATAAAAQAFLDRKRSDGLAA